MLPLFAALAVLTFSSGPPATFAAASGLVVGVAQAPNRVAWLEQTGSGCRLHVLPLGGARASNLPYAPGCLPDQDLALGAAGAAWGGYDEVRCSETHASVYTAGPARGRLVEGIDGDCLGYRTAYQGLATDGGSYYYSLVDTSTPGPSSQNCGNGGGCRWRLAGGEIDRIAGGGHVKVPGLPAAALIAGTGGRLALVPAAGSASSNGKTFDWPRATTNGTVQIRSTASWGVVSSFAPQGIVRAVALSASRAAVLVQSGASMRIEWYDSGSGARLGSVPVPGGTAHRISTDGNFVAFSAGRTVRVLDLGTGRQRIVRTAPAPPLGLSVLDGRLLWAENGRRRGRLVSAAA